MSTVSIVIKTNRDASIHKIPDHRRKNIVRVLTLIKGLVAGTLLGTMDVYASSADPVNASGTITPVSVIAGNTITVATTTLTAATSPANENQFQSAGTDTVVAAAIAAAVNVHSVLSKIASATSAANVVTVSCVVPGPIGNLVALSSSGATVAVSGAVLAGGLGGPQGAPERVR